MVVMTNNSGIESELTGMGCQSKQCECIKELDTARKSYHDLRVQYSRLEAERNQYLQDLHQQDQRCRTLEQEIQRLQNEIQIVRRRERDLEMDLADTRSDLKKAKATIQVQSRAIQGRPARNNPPQAHPQPSHALSQYAQDFGFGPKPLINIRPDPRESLYGPPQLQDTPYRPTSSRHLYSDDARNQALTKIQPDDPQWDIQWPTEFSNFFARVEKFCHDNFNVPNEETDAEWSLTLADTIARESHRNHVTDLVNDCRTRYLLLTRIILSWIDSHYFHVKIVKGFSKDSDTKVHEYHRQMKNMTSMSTSTHRALATAEAATIHDITKEPGWEAWKTNRIREDVNKLMSRLASAIAPGSHRALLGQTLQSILIDAWRIGLMMATRPLVFHVWFPPARDESLFNPKTMLNRNPYGRQVVTPDELEKRGAKVGLGITPHVTILDLFGEKGETRTVHLAGVVLRE